MNNTFKNNVQNRYENENTKVISTKILKEIDGDKLVCVTLEKYVNIYRIKLANGKIYIGQTEYINDRLNSHNNRFKKENIIDFKIIKYKAKHSDEINYIKKYRERYGYDNVVNVSKGSYVEEPHIDSFEAWFIQTPTQLAISAWNYYNSVKANGDKITMGEAAAKFGSSVAQVKRVNKIGGTGARHYKRPDIIELLFSSIKFNISSDPTRPYETDSLYTIEEYLAKQKKQLESQSKRSVQKRVIELSDEEEDKVMNAIIDLKRESAVVRDAIARRLYAYNMNQNQQ